MAKALLVASLIGFVALVASPDAQAKPKKKSCARAVINDWYGDGQIDKQYEPHCYKEAIRALPVDIKDYSHAPEDILRALAYRKLGKPDPGNGSAPGTDPAGTDSGPGDPQQPGADDTAPSDSNGVDTVADPDLDLDTSSPSSIPIPLLVLGGLALLLLAAGGAGYVNRRLQARGTDDPGP